MSGLIGKKIGMTSIYDANGKHYIVFFAKKLEQNIILRIREENKKIQIYAPASENSADIKTITNRWIDIR